MDKKIKNGRIKRFFADFKKFITRGNIIELAIAVIIGAAFGKIITSLVNDIIMPPIAFLIGGKSVADLKWVFKDAVLNPDTGEIITAESALRYGNFIQTIIDFLIIAFFIFLVLRIVMNLKKGYEELEKGIMQYSAKERKAFIKEKKAQGYKKKEIYAMLEQKEKEEAEQKALEDEQKRLKAEAEKQPTTQELLAEIVQLLKEKK